MAGRVTDPIELPEGFWDRPDVLEALRTRSMRRLFKLVQRFTGASQTRIGIAVVLSQGTMSTIMSGQAKARAVKDLDVFERIADGLKLPDHARMALGLAPRHIPARGTAHANPRPTPPSHDEPPATEVSWDDVLDLTSDGGTDPVKRRSLLGAAALAVLPGVSCPQQEVALLAKALTTYPFGGLTDQAPPPTLRTLTADVSDAKRNYQACHYGRVTRTLPATFDALRLAADYYSGDQLSRVLALSAEAHHVAASILLKFGDAALAGLAAERAVQAAQASRNPLAIGSGARIITHTLMNDGHTRRAKTFDRRAALHLDQATSNPTPALLSVYGSLLLRGAIAAANDDDRSGALELIDEADQAAQRVGGDHNHHWTAFGPTNVRLHRVNLAVKLGDAGNAIEHARHVDQRQIDVTERRAALYLDVAKAFTQWGKYDRAYHAIRSAETIAPEEIAQRPAVLRVADDLATRAPADISRQVRDLIIRVKG